MTDVLHLTIVVLIIAVVVWVTSNAVFSAYFRAREAYWHRLVKKAKESKDGKGRA